MRPSFEALKRAVEAASGSSHCILDPAAMNAIAATVRAVENVANGEIREDLSVTLAVLMQLAIEELAPHKKARFTRYQDDLLGAVRDPEAFISHRTRQLFIDRLHYNEDGSLRCLIEAGADINAEYPGQSSILTYFAIESWFLIGEEERLRCLQRAIEHGARVTEDLLELAAKEPAKIGTLLETTYLSQRAAVPRTMPRIARACLSAAP